MKETIPSSDRRDFLKGAAAASLLGAAGLSPALAQSTSPQYGAGPQADDQDPQRPAGLVDGAEPDSRFPIFYERSVPEGMGLVVQYFKALSQRDLEGMAGTLQYPFVTYERYDPVIINSSDELMKNPPPSMDVIRKGSNLPSPGQMHFLPGSYDLLDGIHMHIANPLGAGFSIESSRYRADGVKLKGIHTLVGVTNNDGKWGIEYLSTIMQPVDQLTETYDALACITSLHDDWRKHGEGRFEGNNATKEMQNTNRFVGRNVNVWLGGSSLNSGPARAGRPMDPYKIKGVKTRIRINDLTQAQYDSDPTPAQIARGAEEGKHWMEINGEPNYPWYESSEFPDTKVLFGSHSKCHMYSGYRRYTADGTIISEQRFLTAAICHNGIWKTSDIHGMFGQIMYRDHLNDTRNA